VNGCAILFVSFLFGVYSLKELVHIKYVTARVARRRFGAILLAE
jgi:hypothetical protein